MELNVSLLKDRTEPRTSAAVYTHAWQDINDYCLSLMAKFASDSKGLKKKKEFTSSYLTQMPLTNVKMLLTLSRAKREWKTCLVMF